MQNQVKVEKEPNLCFKIWHIFCTWIFCLFVLTYAAFEFHVFKANTLIHAVHPGAGSCWSPNAPAWYLCQSFKFSYKDPGTAPDGKPYINVTAEYHGIVVGAITLAVLHLCSTFLHCIPVTATRKIAHKFQILLHITTLACAIAATVKVYSHASRSCG